MTIERECVICHKSFVPNSYNQILCSYECTQVRKKQYRKKNKTTEKKPLKDQQRKCVICQNLFVPDVSNQKVCSKECGDALTKINHKASELRLMRKKKKLSFEDSSNSEQNTPEETSVEPSVEPVKASSVEELLKEKPLLACPRMHLKATTLPCGIREECFSPPCEKLVKVIT